MNGPSNFLCLFWHCSYKMWCRTQKHQGDLTLGQQGYTWEVGAATIYQEYFCPCKKESGCRNGRVHEGSGLVSYSVCRLEETHSRHPDRRGLQQIHVQGWPRPSELHHLQSSLGKQGSRSLHHCATTTTSCLVWYLYGLSYGNIVLDMQPSAQWVECLCNNENKHLDSYFQSLNYLCLITDHQR